MLSTTTMHRRSTPRHFYPTGVGSYTATSSHPFNRRFFEDLDRRLARDSQPAAPTLTVPLGDALSFPPTSRA